MMQSARYALLSKKSNPLRTMGRFDSNIILFSINKSFTIETSWSRLPPTKRSLVTRRFNSNTFYKSCHDRNLQRQHHHHHHRHLPLLQSNIGSIQHLSTSSRPPRPPNRTTTSLIASISAGSLLLLSKGKYLLGALKLTKFASLGSMFVTIGTYSIFFGPAYAVGMVGLILVHESGHALVMKRLGIPFNPMIFVPFVGASVSMNRSPRDAYEEALIAFGGPVVGSLGAVGCAGVGHATGSQLMFALADFGFMINLFNLMPIGMMDGGRICGALSPYAGVVGLGMGGGLIYVDAISNPIFYLVMLSGAWSTFRRFYNPQEGVPLNYYKITNAQRVGLTTGYFGLIGALMGAMAFNNNFKKSPQVLERERQFEEKFWVD